MTSRAHRLSDQCKPRLLSWCCQPTSTKLCKRTYLTEASLSSLIAMRIKCMCRNHWAQHLAEGQWSIRSASIFSESLVLHLKTRMVGSSAESDKIWSSYLHTVMEIKMSWFMYVNIMYYFEHCMVHTKYYINVKHLLFHFILLVVIISQIYGISSSHAPMWELDHREDWAPKNWCFWTVVLEETLESPLGCKEIQLSIGSRVNPKGNQSWIFIGRTDAEAEAPIVWPPEVKSLLFRKNSDARKDGRQEEKGMSEVRSLGGITDLMDMSLSKLPEMV